MTETIKAEPIPDTMLDELTDTQRKIVLALHALQQADKMDILNGVEKIVQERDKTARSFWRAIIDAWWSGVTQAHAEYKKLFKE